MNKVKNTQRVFINTLNTNDEFYVPGINTPYVCESRISREGWTTVNYRVKGENTVYTYSRPNLSTADLVTV